MADLVERLRTWRKGTNARDDFEEVSPLMHIAAAEIEHLRGVLTKQVALVDRWSKEGRAPDDAVLQMSLIAGIAMRSR